MRLALAYLAVLLAAAVPFLEVLLVVPAGIVAGLSPAATVVVAAAGNVATLALLVVAGDRLRRWWRGRGRRRPERAGATAAGSSRGSSQRADLEAAAPSAGTGVPERSDAADRPVAEASAEAPDEGGTEPRSRGAARARRVFERYGLPGLAALGPLLTGVHIAAVVALAAGARRRPTLAWLAGGVVVWAIVAAGATLLGIESLVDPDALPDLFSAPPR
jgi:uncharacterized membrane protein